jgi:dUTP pyrophosphatase
MHPTEDQLIQFKLVHPMAKCPSRGTPMSGAFDVYAPEGGKVNPFEKITIGTGLSHQIAPRIDMLGICVIEGRGQAASHRIAPFALQGVMIPRSGLAARDGIRLFFAPCLIDHDYRGEIKITLENHNYKEFIWQQGDRLCQIAYIPMYMGGCVEVADLTETKRGEGGHGSTGK